MKAVRSVWMWSIVPVQMLAIVMLLQNYCSSTQSPVSDTDLVSIRGGEQQESCPVETSHDCDGQQLCEVNSCGDPYSVEDPPGSGYYHNESDCDTVQEHEILWNDATGLWYTCAMEQGASHANHNACTDPNSMFFCSTKYRCDPKCEWVLIVGDEGMWVCVKEGDGVSDDNRPTESYAFGDEECEPPAS